MKKLIIILAALAMIACGPRATIKGHIVCAAGGNDTIYLEQLTASGQHVVDSAAAANGKFNFAVKLPDTGPVIYTIRCHGQVVPLLVSRGEKVEVKGFGNIARTYTVSGSPGSEQLRELVMILNNGAATLDSLTSVYTRMESADTTLQRTIIREYVKAYNSTKQNQIRFIVTYPGSLAALYGLYQRLPNDHVLFNGPESDVVYYRLVADSVQAVLPASPYLTALRADIDRMSHRTIDPDKIHVVSYPDIEVPDMYGKKVKLSSLEGNVVLIDFWSAAVPRSRLLNAELKELYAALHSRGFEVYQVSVDTDKPLWINSILEQKLPWTTVCDLRGNASAAVLSYNINSVPANFLLDRQGNLVGKNLYGQELENKVKSLL